MHEQVKVDALEKHVIVGGVDEGRQGVAQQAFAILGVDAHIDGRLLNNRLGELAQLSFAPEC